MKQSTLSRKLLLKAGQTATVLNAPTGFEQTLEPLPERAAVSHTLKSKMSFALLFVRNVRELERWGAKLVRAMAHDGLLWVAYPKKSSKMESDITRDVGWDVITRAGLRCVAQIAIDATWSASRFRPLELVGSSRKA